jgi:hypothetical protein
VITRGAGSVRPTSGQRMVWGGDRDHLHITDMNKLELRLDIKQPASDADHCAIPADQLRDSAQGLNMEARCYSWECRFECLHRVYQRRVRQHNIDN